MAGGDAGDVLDRVELDDAIEHVADVARVDTAGEADGHGGVERLPLLQAVHGMRLAGRADVGERRRQ
jgi:hypothetical protein